MRTQSCRLERTEFEFGSRVGNRLRTQRTSLAVEDATLLGMDGSNTFISGTATVKVGANTL